jgi:hypothetical protein
MKRLTMLLAASVIATGALAHGTGKGPNGGWHADAGSYHIELLAKGTSLVLFLNDDDDKPIEARGHKGVGLFVIEGKPQRIELAPESDNRLAGVSSVPLPERPKGSVHITLPTGKTVRAKFE